MGLSDKWSAGDAYEAFMGRWSRLMARQFIHWLNPLPRCHWLDVGCGTGALTAAILELCDPASVDGIDPSEPFIVEARQNNPGTNVSFGVGGVDSLPRKEGGYDLVVSGLALNFFPDPVLAVLAMKDRAKQEGRIAAYVWDYSDGMAFLRYFWDAAVSVEPSAAELDEGQRFPLCHPERLIATFSEAGLSKVVAEELLIDTVFANFSDYWSPFMGGTGPAPAFVAALNSEGRTQLEERLMSMVPTRQDGSLHLQARAWGIRGIVS